MEPCSQIQAGLINETICLAFLTSLGLMRPSISPVLIPICLSTWPHTHLLALRGATAGLASGLCVYSSHLATAGLCAKSLFHLPILAMGGLSHMAVSSWLSRCHVTAHVCIGYQGLHTRGDGTELLLYQPALQEVGGPTSGPVSFQESHGPEGHVVHLLSLKEGGPACRP